MIGHMIGHLEMLGLRFPVRHYQEWVTPGILMRGSRLSDLELLDFTESILKSILNLCAENDDDLERQVKLGLYPRVRVEHIPVLDNFALTQQQIDFCLGWIEDPINQPCYVHCEAGKGRTGVVVACYRISKGWSLNAALIEARQHGMTLPEQIACVSRYCSRVGGVAG